MSTTISVCVSATCVALLLLSAETATSARAASTTCSLTGTWIISGYPDNADLDILTLREANDVIDGDFVATAGHPTETGSVVTGTRISDAEFDFSIKQVRGTQTCPGGYGQDRYQGDINSSCDKISGIWTECVGLTDEEESSEFVRNTSLFLIANVGSGRCLTGNGPDGPIVIADCDSSEGQLFTWAADDSLRLYNDLCLDVGTAARLLITRTCNDLATQGWIVAQDSHLENGQGRCAWVLNDGQGQGDAVVVRLCRERQSQQFVVIPVGTKVEQCFGAIGSKCAPLPRWLPSNLTHIRRTRRNNPDGTQQMAVSVGSIAHDNCCLVHPNGVMCKSGSDGEDTHCKAEWRQAESDVLLHRFWTHTFRYLIDHYTDDLQIEAGRKLWLPDPDEGIQDLRRRDSCFDPEVVDSPRETPSSLELKAPRRTKLDCTDAHFCGSGTADQPAGKDYIVCNR